MLITPNLLTPGMLFEVDLNKVISMSLTLESETKPASERLSGPRAGQSTRLVP